MISKYDKKAISFILLLILVTTTFITFQLGYKTNFDSDNESKKNIQPDRIIDYESNVLNEEIYVSDIPSQVEIFSRTDMRSPFEDMIQNSQDSEKSGIKTNPRNQKASGLNTLSYIVKNRVFNADGNTEFVSMINTFGLSGSGTSNDPYLIENLSITNSSDLIYIRNVDLYFIIRNNYLDGQLKGIYLQNVWNGLIRDNYIRNTITAISTDITNVSVINNTIFSSLAGIGVQQSNYLTVANNTISLSGTTGYGISLWGNDFNTVYRNDISNGGYGIKLGYADHNVVFNNTVRYSRNPAIYLYPYNINNTFYDNFLTSGTDDGINIGFSNLNSTFRNNTITNFQQRGLDADSTTQFTILDGNTFTFNKYGVYISGLYHTIVNNTIYGNSENGLQGFQMHNSSIYSNFIYNNNLGFYIGGQFNDVYSNIVYSNIFTGLRVGANFNSVANNIVFSNGKFGIQINYANNNLIHNNSIYGNSDDGIQAYYSPNNTITDNILLKNGFSLYSLNLEDFVQLLVSGNTLDGKPINYVKNAIDTTIDGQTLSQIIVVNSTNVRIKNLVIANSESMSSLIQVYSSTNIAITNNNLTTAKNGILLWYTNDSQIKNNIIENTSLAGIYLELYSYNNTIESNILANNKKDSIVIAGYSSLNKIIDNTMVNSTQYGIYLFRGSNNTVSNNFIQKNNYGIYLYYYSLWNNISYNTVLNSSVGIDLNYYSSDNYIFNNNISFSSNGIRIRTNSLNSEINSNYIYNTLGTSIYVYGNANNNNITNNTILKSNSNCIQLVSTSNEIQYNEIINCRTGIFVSSSSNVITNNIIFNSTLLGLRISFNRNNNLIEFNDFISNNMGATSQLEDSGLANTIRNNYYEDWKVPDVDNNYIVDEPYFILGNSNNFDPTPLTNLTNTPLSNLHILSRPRLVFPTNGELLNNSILLQWVPSIDNLGHSFSYSILYSTNDVDWSLLVSGLTNASYSVNTLNLVDDLYSFRVISKESVTGLEVYDDSDVDSFIHNIISVPEITFPQGPLVFNNTVIIIWNASNDILNHIIYYSIDYSTDGVIWTNLALNITDTNATWDTLQVTDNDSYLIRITANDGFGFVSQSILGLPITVHNYIGVPTLISPQSGDIVQSSLFIKWKESTNIVTTQITYSVYYSTDDGFSWNLIVENLLELNYTWNSSLLPDGTGYKVKINSSEADGYSSEFILSGTFTIHNGLSAPVLISPNGGETLQKVETIFVQWNPATDNLSHTITYSVYYLKYDGITWILLVDDLQTTSYVWDTSNIENIKTKIRIVASDGFGLVTEDISNTDFSIFNIIDSSPPSTSSQKSSSTDQDPQNTSGLTVFTILSLIGIVIYRRKTNLRK